MIQMMIGAPNKALIVLIGSGYIASEQSTSHISNRQAPIRALAGMVIR